MRCTAQKRQRQVKNMELFDKVYGCYYNILRHMLTEAASRPITRREMEDAEILAEIADLRSPSLPFSG